MKDKQTGQATGQPDKLRNKVIEILRNSEQTFVFSDSIGEDHPFQGLHHNKYNGVAADILAAQQEEAQVRYDEAISILKPYYKDPELFRALKIASGLTIKDK